jgi:hypothetical protein
MVLAPFAFRALNSVSQSIYLSSEIGMTGLITDIEYTLHPGAETSPFANMPSDKTVSFYIGTTNQSVFTANGWIGLNQLTHVFTGTLPATQAGNTFKVTLETPFNYLGGNLVIMGHRHLDTEIFNSPHVAYISTFLPANMNRVIVRDAADFINPAAPGNHTNLGRNRPNVRLYFKDEPHEPLAQITRFPFTEGFEGALFPPFGWMMNPAGFGAGISWFPYAHTPRSGYYCAASASWWGGSALQPNNWLITPQLILPTGLPIKLEYYVAAQDWEFPREHYGVFVSTTGVSPGNFTLIHNEILTNDQWLHKSHDLSAYAGQEIYIAFRHYNCTDQFVIKLDDISVTLIAEYDLMAVSLSGTQIPIANVPNEYIVNVSNVGSQAVSNYTVKLMKMTDTDPIELATTNGTTVAAGATVDVTLSWTPTTVGSYQIYGEIVFVEDQHEPNNQTPLFNISVLPTETFVSIQGNNHSTTAALTHPFDYNSRNNFAQTIYMESEINSHGFIRAISYNFSNYWGEIPAGIPVKVWMGTTDVNVFATTSSWIPHNTFTLVYEGDLPVTKIGDYTVEIPLNTPYQYSGGNLVIMTSREWIVNGNTYSDRNIWQTTATPNQNRTLNLSSASQLVPQSLGAGLRIQNIPNVRLYFDTTPTGNIAGTVVHNGNPLADVKISLNGSMRSEYTDSNGQFNMKYVLKGTVGITASKLMYATQVVENIVVVDGQTNTQNITMLLSQYEIAVLAISGPTLPSIGQPTPYIITVRNEGANTIIGTDYSVKLKQVNNAGADIEIASVLGITLSSGQSSEIIVPWVPGTAGIYNIYGMVEYALDEFHGNNQTNTIRVEVNPAGTVVTYIGDPETEMQSPSSPYAMTRNNSINQNIYLAEEINGRGQITHVTYTLNSAGTLPGNRPVRMWMKTTEQRTFTSGGWLSLDGFTEVFNGTINVSAAGIYDVTLALTTPFNYTGGNLVITTHMPWIAVEQWQFPYEWLITPTPEARTLTFGTSMHTINLNVFSTQYDLTQASAFTPNTRFIINVGDMGAVSGLVTHNGNPLPDVEVSVADTNITAITNSSGRYMLSYIPVGNVDIVATKHGFQDYLHNNLTIVNGTTITHDIVINSRPTVNVTGTVVVKGTDIGIEGVNISMFGYADYVDIVTDADGKFTIPGVFAYNTYSLFVTHGSHFSYRNESVVVGNTNLDLGNIEMVERISPPSNVVAVATTSQVNLSWSPPAEGSALWFTHAVNEIRHDAIGGVNSFMLAQRFSSLQIRNLGLHGGELTKIAFMPDATTEDYTYTLKVWVGGSTGPLNPGTEVLSQVVSSPLVAREMNTIELTTAVPIPDTGELWIGYHVNSAGASRGSVDAGPGVADYGDVIFWGEQWLSMSIWGFNNNWLIKGHVEGAVGPALLSHFVDTTPTLMIQNDHLSSRNRDIRFAFENMEIPTSYLRTMGISNSTPVGMSISHGNGHHIPFIQPSPEYIERATLGYNIYRTSVADIDNQGSWTSIATNHQGTTFTDDSWVSVGYGYYQYVVIAAYVNNVFSEPAFSNIVESYASATVKITINTVDSATPAGAMVRLVNNQNSSIVYQQTASGNLVTFEGVALGTYTLTISHPNYVQHVNKSLNVVSTVDYSHTIGLPTVSFEEDFESTTFPPTGWAMLDVDGDSINWRHSSTFNDSTVPTPPAKSGSGFAFSESFRNNAEGGIAFAPNNYLITPAINLPDDTDIILYYHALTFLPNWPAEVYSVMISTSTPSVANFVPLFTETLTAHENIWRERIVSLSEYAGETVYIAFRHHTPQNADMFAIGIDDVQVIYASSGTDEVDIIGVPLVTALRANYPNPFNPTTNIQFDIAVEGHVQIEVYNIRGQRVTTLVNEHLGIGSHSVVWDGTNRIGRNVSSGLYFYKMTTGEYTETRKMLLMK